MSDVPNNFSGMAHPKRGTLDGVAPELLNPKPVVPNESAENEKGNPK
jgi:hypothetical protein